MRTYKPDGTGHCKACDSDVGAHDGGHTFIPQSDGERFRPEWGCDAFDCAELPKVHPIHDVGRVLRCPEVRDGWDRLEGWDRLDAQIHDTSPIPEVRDDSL